ncbi:glycoside hydrolase family 38 C-terminal domain-containing protein [Streptomyces sp. NP-1717]|uniref:alpha-mannosidase n=1 Tax=Streptomyces sp. NP-1717 TaxID=2704470 RepID=UPI001F5D7709|nr:glycoside hydrolase family 38 C-terminal domain-containing protein [Streptomyces sp. NP-1717]MCI3222951.1 alpha-mannosidase [Streptomyces sp. NP-1717]
MHDRRKSQEARTAHFLDRRLRPALYTERLPMEVGAWHIPGEPVPVDVALRAGYTPFVVGETWGGGPWSTSWFRLGADVPERWAGLRVEAVVDLGGEGAEGLVHDEHGTPLQGLHPNNSAVTVTTAARGGEPVRLLVEAAANPAIDAATGAGAHFGNPVTAGDEPLHQLLRADLAVRDENIWQLIHDIDVLYSLMRALPVELPRRHEILRALDRAVDAVDPRDIPGTAAGARDILAPVLARRAHESAHTVAAVGHARPGAARLRPMRESVRASARAFSSMAALAEEYPELVFAASSAQQHAWMKDRHPHVFERIRKAVARGNWVPVGGMWVEPDAILPGGESLARQLVHGRRFHREELGLDSDGVWLPGPGGMSAAVPQLAALAGASWLLGHTFAEHDTNSLPHHTFRWEGTDGSRIFTHCPPAGAGHASLTGPELADVVAAYADKGGGTRSLLPFGRGPAVDGAGDDGAGGADREGHGPTRETLERARRLADLEGSPRVEIQHPAHFFRDALDEYPHAPVWRGELYAQTHHGSYTSQARTKRGNRRSESLLREAELWSATAAVRDAVPYPYDELDALWKRVLLHQSRDILPGGAIAWVHEEAEQAHREIRRRLQGLIRRSAGGPDGDTVLNAGPRARREVVVLDRDRLTGPGAVGAGQPLSDGGLAVLAEAPALGRGPAGLPLGGTAPVTVTAAGPARGGGHLLDNGLLRVHVDPAGLVRSARDLTADREAIAPGGAGNLLQLLRDDPARWSASALDVPRPDTRRDAAVGVRRDLDTASCVEVTDNGPLLARIRVARGTGRSTVTQRLTLTAGSRALTIDTDVDWREQDTLLKAAWPLDVHAENSCGEIQYGHVERPTHENTSWDAARYEQWAHRWIHVGEHGWGVALASDATYGYDVSRHTRADAGTTTLVRLSLLRAAHSPDPHADRGPHSFRHTLRPGADVGDAISEGYALNLPLRPGPSAGPAEPLVAVDDPDVVVEAVKLADDRSGDVVVRLYESRGGRARATLTAGFPVTAVRETDLLEETLAIRAHTGRSVALTLRPFQILTLRLVRGGGPEGGSGV